MRGLASPIKLNRDHGHLGVPILAVEQGFEPQLTVPETVVLPLDDSTILRSEAILLKTLRKS